MSRFMNEGYADAPSRCGSKRLLESRPTYPDACVAMVELLGTRAGLQPSDGVLDVGVGFAEQDFVLLDRFKEADITGIDITPVHIDRAGNASPSAGWRNKSTFGSVPRPQWNFPTHRLKKSWPWNAHSTLTRGSIHARAFRVLKPGGIVALADMLPNPGKKLSLMNAFGRKYGHFPKPTTMTAKSTHGGSRPGI